MQAKYARAVFRYAVKESGIADKPSTTFDRFIPNQDTTTELGNLIALPFYGKVIGQGHTLILDPATGYETPYPDQDAAIQNIGRVSLEQIEAIIEKFNLVIPEQTGDKAKGKPKQPGGKGGTQEGVYAPSSARRIRKLCGYIKHCQDDAKTLPEPHWYMGVSVLCRCEDGREVIHELSKDYAGYSEEETDAKIAQVGMTTEN